MNLKLILMASCLIGLVACRDSEYELDNLVPEEYHKILYVNNGGKQALTLYDTEEDYKFTFSVVKSGSDPSLVANASIGLMSQAQVDEEYSVPEGVNYSIIGDDCYSLETTQVDFSSSDRYKLVDVFFKPQQVKAAMENNPDVVWVLPLQITSATDSVNAEMDEVFLELEAVVSPTVGFIDIPFEIVQIEYSSLSTFTEELAFGLDVNNNWDLECYFSVDVDYVNEYNRANGTLFNILPEGSYTVPETMTLANGETTAELEVVIEGQELTPGDYMLPVSITGISMFEVSESNSVYPLLYRVMGNMLDRTGWTAEATSEETSGEGAGNGVAGCLLDDNLSTYWHSRWQNGMDYPPFEIVIDMQDEVTVSQIAMAQRGNGFTDTALGQFSISSDEEHWTEIGEFSMEAAEGTQMFSVDVSKGRYLKIRIESSHRDGYASLSEVYVYGLE